MSQAIRVLLVDNHKLTCTAVRSLLLGIADIILLDEIATTTNLKQFCARHEPDILLLSLEMVREFAIASVTICPEAKILLLVTNCTGFCHSELTGNNVLGCLVRDQIPDQLILAIRGTMAGVTCYSQSVAQRLSQLPDDPVSCNQVESLTPREKEVLCLIATGLTNKQIALLLQISEATVEYHVGNIFQKLVVESRVEAAVWAKTHHLI